MEARRDVFQAIADPTRREIIGLLAGKSLNLNAISENFDMTRQAISLHIKILQECGLIAITQVGRERFCEAKLGTLSEVANWVEQYREFWMARLDIIGGLLNELQAADKKKNKKSTPKKRLK